MFSFKVVKYTKKLCIITTILAFVISILITSPLAQAVYYEIDWDDSLSPTGLPLNTELSIFASPFYGPLFVGATNGRLYLSLDDGDNWTETQPAGDVDKNWSSLSISSDGQTMVAVVTNGRIYVSVDGGDNWTETQPAGDVDKNWSKVIVTSESEVIIALVSGGRMYRTTDIGDNWEEIGAPLDVDLEWSAINFNNLGRTALAAARNGRFYVSSDDGATWFEIQPAGDADYDWSTISCEIGGLHCLAAVDGGRIYRSYDEGFSWTEIQPAGNTTQNWSMVGVSEYPILIAAANPGRLYYSTDDGLHWYESQPSGDSDQNYTAAMITYDGSSVWTANQSEVIYHGVFSAPSPGQPNSFTHTTNITSIKTLLGEPLYKINEIQNSGTGIFSFAHGNVTVGNKFYIGTRTSPAKIVVFNDPNDLNDYTAVTLPGLVGLESLTYDSVSHRIYGVGTNSFGAQDLKIYSFDPDNIASYSQVVNEASLIDYGSSAIINDGTYLYGVTYASPPIFFKFRISDWELEATRTWTGGPSSGHSVAMQIYSDRTELYFGASLGTSAVAKVNTIDLTYVDYNFGGLMSFSDDIYFRYIDNAGGILYFGSEDDDTGYALDTRTMISIAFSNPSTYGYFSNGQDLYSVGKNGYLSRIVDFDLDSERFYETSGEIPNELFFSSTGQKFFTNWSSPGYLKEIEETDILATNSTVILTWDLDSVPETSYEIYISTNGVDYSLYGIINSSPFTIQNLTPNTQYWFRVVAKNGVAASTPAAHSLVTPPFVPASLPFISNVHLTSRTKTSLSISWEGVSAENYIVKQGSTSSGWGSFTSYTFSDLLCGQEYQFKIKGKNSDGVQGEYQLYNFSTQSCSGGSSNIIFPEINKNSIRKIEQLISEDSIPLVYQPCKDDVLDDLNFVIQSDPNFLKSIKGRLFLATEDKGKLYYIDPHTNQPYYLTQSQAQCLLERISLGITNENLKNIPEVDSLDMPSRLANRLQGFILLQVENRGQTWFVDYSGFRHKLIKENLVSTLANFALGIIDSNLKKIISF
jgi:photosystem II stability/assembly factor-like uncharacterized protein